MTGAQLIYNSIKSIGKFTLKINENKKVDLVEEDLIFEKDKLWFLNSKQKSKGVLIVKWDGKDCNEFLNN